MKQLHWKQEMQYLRTVADMLTNMGYQVEEPDVKHRDLLDVWGMAHGRKCFIEIYVTMYPIRDAGSQKSVNGTGGIWHQGEHDGVEVHLYNQSYDGRPILYEVDDLTIILDNLKPFKTKRKAGL